LFNKKSPQPIFFKTIEELNTFGIPKEVELWEDGFRTNRNKGFFEWWYFDAHFDDGTTVVVVFMTKSITEYKGPLKPAIMITINRKDGSKLFKAKKYAVNSFFSSKEQCDVKMGTNFVNGDLKEYHLYSEIDDVLVDLTFKGIVKAWRPGEGKIYFGDHAHYFGWVAPIPHGTVKGSLSYDGKTHEVKGVGYHDHNWGNLSLPAIQDHWYWGRTTLDEYTVIFVEQTTTKNYGSVKLPVFLVAKGSEVLIEEGEMLKLETSDFINHASGHKYPNKLIFKWEKGEDKVVITLTNPRIIEATGLLSAIPKWKQKVARLFVNPYYFRFHSEITLEINYQGIKTVKFGNTLYELMQLR